MIDLRSKLRRDFYNQSVKKFIILQYLKIPNKYFLYTEVRCDSTFKLMVKNYRFSVITLLQLQSACRLKMQSNLYFAK